MLFYPVHIYAHMHIGLRSTEVKQVKNRDSNSRQNQLPVFCSSTCQQGSGIRLYIPQN